MIMRIALSAVDDATGWIDRNFMTFKSSAKSAAPYVLGATKLSVDTLRSLCYGIPVPWINLVVGAAASVIETAGVSCQRFIIYHGISAQSARIGGSIEQPRSQIADRSRLRFDAGHRASIEGEICNRDPS
jgi:hypothetical protein